METIRATHLVKTYGRGELAVRALDDVTLTVQRGELAALVGPSGSGKSTLLTTLGLLAPPDEGDLWLEGRAVVRAGHLEGDLAELRRTRIGFVFQKPNLIPFLDARENVEVALQLIDTRGRVARARAEELLTELGLADRMHHYPEELSGGQQQRVAIARALATRPGLILADEPTAALDGARGRSVMELLREVAHHHEAAVIVVTHDHRTLDVFDTVYSMDDGHLALDEGPRGSAAVAPHHTSVEGGRASV